MSNPVLFTALNAIAQPAMPAGSVPEWLRLFPKGRAVAVDGRGPWFYDDAERVVAATFAEEGWVHVDLEHSSLPGKNQADTRAYGYVTGIEERDDGLWGRIDWTAAGAELMKDRAYWGVSPVFTHDKTGRLKRIVSVTLTNNPALRQLTALTFTKENGMEFLEQVAEALGLSTDASEADVLAALTAKLKAAPAEDEATAALTALRGALGIEDGASQTEALAMAKALASATEDNAALSARVAALESGDKKAKAEAFVASAIADKRAGAVAAREELIALHMEAPAKAEALVAKMPQLGEAGLTADHGKGADKVVALTAEQKGVADQLGVPHDDYLAQLTADAELEAR